MIDCGTIKVHLSVEGKYFVRLRVEQDMPPGHLPKRLAEVLINKKEFSNELAGIVGIEAKL